MRKNSYLAKQKRQFKGLCKQISRNWDKLSSQKQENLLARFRRLYSRLKLSFARPALSRMMGTAALVLAGLGTAQAQGFKAPVMNPFGLPGVPSNQSFATPYLGDINGDGILDIVTGTQNGTMHSCNGVVGGVFTSFQPMKDTTNTSLDILAESHPTLVDIDDDGDLDMFVGTGGGSFHPNEAGSFYFVQNLGISTQPIWDIPVRDTFGLTDLGVVTDIAFADLDNDGDLDALAVEFYGTFYYYENTGTTSLPAFAAPQANPFGLTDLGGRVSVNLLDWDQDGDMDVFSGELYDSYYMENTGTASAPSYATAVKNPFGIVPYPGEDQFNYTFGDLNGDGYLDILAGAGDKNFYYYEYDTALTVSTVLSAGEALEVELQPNPTQSELNINLSTLGTYELTVSNVAGVIIHRGVIENNNQLQLNTALWPQGMYLVQLRDEKGQLATEKVLKQ